MKNKDLEYSISRHNLTPLQKAKADKKLVKKRFERLSKMTDEQKIYADLISLKFRAIDYVEQGIFSESFLFSEFLKRYVSIIKMSRRKLASDLGIHETRFSRIINNKENPGIGLLYRIEEHSNKILPASLLWQIVNIKLTLDIEQNTKERKKESRLVKNKLKLQGASRHS